MTSAIRHAIAVLVAVLALLHRAAGAAAADETPAFAADWLRLPKTDVEIGGRDGKAVVARPDLDLVARIVLAPADVRRATLKLAFASSAAGASGSTAAGGEEGSSGALHVHRLTRPVAAGGSPVAGEHYDRAAPLAAVPLATGGTRRQVIELNDLGPLLADWMTEPAAAHGIAFVVVAAASGAAPRVTIVGKESSQAIAIVRHPAHQLFEHPVRPRPGVYARVVNGKLTYGGERLRLWGVVGFPDPGRLFRMGFNAERLWQPRAEWMYDAASARRGDVKPYVKGDGSAWDRSDAHFAALKGGGGFAMLAALQNTMPLEPLRADDSFVAGGDDWPQWKAAMAASPNKPDHARWVYFDERLQAARKRHARNVLTWLNPYTGVAIGQDEAVAVYEVFNENGGAKRILEGAFDGWPPYFRDKFARRWNAWLRGRYAGGDAALVRAWGRLEAGESLAAGTVAPGPVFADRNTFPKARAADFVRFVIEMVDAFHQDFRAHCRTLAPGGVGVAVAPFSFDTQYRPSLAWSYLQSRGDVNSFGMYFWDLASSLRTPPAMYVMDSHTAAGAATVIYETNAGRPNPARAEYPLKLAAVAAWQDWDGVFFHYWSKGPGAVDEAYLAAAMPHVTASHFWSGVHHEVDPAMAAAMAAAGRAFLGGHVRPAAAPVAVTVGRDALFGYDAHNGVGLAQQTFASGAHLRYAPDATGGITDGPGGAPLTAPHRVTAAVAAVGGEIVWDWPNGRLIVDTSTFKGYAGKVAGAYRFKDGITLADVGAPFVAFYLSSGDGRPLAGADPARRAYVTAVANAENTGFDFDWSIRGGPAEQAKAVRDRGRAPVVVDRVPFALYFPTELTGRLTAYDFALRRVGERAVTGTNRVAHDGPTPFISVLELDRRGAATPTPDTALAIATGSGRGAGEAPHGAAAVTPAAPAGAWSPVPEISWDADYHAAHKALRDATWVSTSISKEDFGPGSDKAITVADAEVPALWSAPADLEFVFARGGLARLVVTFRQPPPLGDVIAAYDRQFGAPAQKRLAAQFETSVARWPATGDRPAVSVTESQGVLRILFERPRRRTIDK